MLYWICPECGHECSPAVRECPTCTAPPETAPAAAATKPAVQAAPEPPAPASSAPEPAVQNHELLTLAQNFESPSATSPAPAPQRPPAFSTNGHETSLTSSVTSSAIAVEEDVTQEIDLVPALSQKLAPLGKPDLRAASPSRLAPVELPALPIPSPIASPALATAAATVTPSQYSLRPAGPAPWTADVEFEAAPASEMDTHAKSSEPIPSRRRSVVLLRAQLPGSSGKGIAAGDLAPLTRLAPLATGGEASSVSAQLGKNGAPRLVASGLKTVGATLTDLLNALKTSAEETDRSGIDAIQASFSEPPSIALLTAPAEVIEPPAPAGMQFLHIEKLKFTPVEPESRGRTFAVAGPQAPTLAGPSLPPQLLNLNHQPSKFRTKRRQWSLWPLSLIIITIVILGIVSGMQYLSQDRDTRAASAAAATPAPTMKAAPKPRTPVIEEHPAARSVEVAGIRIVTAPNKKPQVQFIVINHSGSEITGLNIHIAVRSVDSPADAPLLTVSSPIAALGPNQSKEIHTDVSSAIQPSQIPDWQSLRTEVLVGRQ